MKIKNIPDEVFSALKNRGHNDKEIEAMTPKELFTEYCEWNGLIGYGRGLYSLVVKLRKLHRSEQPAKKKK